MAASISLAITRRFAEAGANVVIASRKLETLETTAREFADLPGRIVPIPCHVGRVDQLERLVREAESQLGPIDILVNNSATNIGQGPALAVARIAGRLAARPHAHRAVLELGDLAERIEDRVGEDVCRRFVVGERDEYRPAGRAFVGTGEK